MDGTKVYHVNIMGIIQTVSNCPVGSCDMKVKSNAKSFPLGTSSSFIVVKRQSFRMCHMPKRPKIEVKIDKMIIIDFVYHYLKSSIQ